jgi:hypothetical protein
MAKKLTLKSARPTSKAQPKSKAMAKLKAKKPKPHKLSPAFGQQAIQIYIYIYTCDRVSRKTNYMSLRLDDPQERKTKNRRFLYALRQARSWFVQLALQCAEQTCVSDSLPPRGQLMLLSNTKHFAVKTKASFRRPDPFPEKSGNICK